MGQLFLGAANASQPEYLLCLVLKLCSLPLALSFRKSSSSASFSTILASSRIVLLLFSLIMRRAFIGLKSPLVAVIVQGILISASIFFMMRVSKAFFSFGRLTLNSMVQMSIDSKFNGADVYSKPFKDTMLFPQPTLMSY